MYAETNGRIEALASVYTETNGGIEALASVYTETNGRIEALASVYTETNGGIEETLLHSRLSLLSIDMDCDRIGEHAVSLCTVQCRRHSTKKNSF